MYLPKRLENTCPQKNLQTSVHCSFLHYRPKAETAQSPPAGGGKGDGGVFVQQSTTLPKRGRAASAQDSGLVSVFTPWGKKRTNTFRVHLQRSWLWLSLRQSHFKTKLVSTSCSQGWPDGLSGRLQVCTNVPIIHASHMLSRHHQQTMHVDGAYPMFEFIHYFEFISYTY